MKRKKPKNWRKIMLIISVFFLLFAPVQNTYAQEKAWYTGPYHYMEGHKQMIFADVGWKWGVDLSVAVYIDLDDMMRASPDGEAGWVTVWIAGNAGLGVSGLPVTVGYAFSDEFGDNGFDDPQVGGAGVSVNFGMATLSTGSLSGYTVEVGLNAGVGVYLETTLMAVEMRKSEIFELIKNVESTDEQFALLAGHILSRFGRISTANASGGIITGAIAVLTDIRDPHWNGDDWDQSCAMLTAYEVQLKEVHETIRNLQYNGEYVVCSIDGDYSRHAVINQKALHHGAPMKGKKKYHFYTNTYWGSECYFTLEDFTPGTHVKIHACVIGEENIQVQLRANPYHVISGGEENTSVIASLDFVTIEHELPIYVTVKPKTGGMHHGYILFEDVTYNSKAGGQEEYVYCNSEYVEKSEIQYPASVPIPNGIKLGAELKPVPIKPNDKYKYKEQPKTYVPGNVWLGKDIGWFQFSGQSYWAYIKGETDHFVKGETYDYTNSDFYNNAGNGPVLATFLYKHGMSYNDATAEFKWFKPDGTHYCTGIDNQYRYWGYVGYGLYICDDGGAGWFPEGEWKCEIRIDGILKKTVLFDVYDPGPLAGRFTFIDPTPKNGTTISGNWNNGQFNITTGVDGFLGGADELKFFINGEEHDILPTHSPITNESEFICSSVWNVKDFADGDYTIRAEISSSFGDLSTEERTITVNNTLPTYCSISSPTGGTITSPYKTVYVSASANTDYVEFFVDGQMRGTDTNAPFSKEIYLANNDATAELTAVAYNTAGKITSSVRTVSLRCVYISSPEEGADLPNDATYNIEAKAVGTVPSNVKFYVNGTLKFIDYGSPYIYPWPITSTSGTFSLKAIADYSSFPDLQDEINVIVGDILTWDDALSMVKERKKTGAAVIMNGYIYAMGGMEGRYSPTTHSSIERAKINSDGSLEPWEICGQLTKPKACITAVHTENYIYVIGDRDFDRAVQRIRVYADGSVGSAQVLSNLTIAAKLNSVAVIWDDYIYILGGSYNEGRIVDYAHINDDGDLGAWEQTSSLNVNRVLASAVVANGYIYIMGDGSTVERAEIDPIDGSLGTWTILEGSLVQGRYSGGAVVHENFIYYIAGTDGSVNLKSVERAYIYDDGSLSPWKLSTSLPYAKKNMCVVNNEGLNDAIYVLGGEMGQTGTGPGYSSASVYYTICANGPTITNVSHSNITSSSAKITWNTNIPCNSRVDYWTDGMYPNYFSTPVTNTSPMTTNHSVTITDNLINDSLYYYRVVSTNDNGNTTMDGRYEFTMPNANVAPTATASASTTSGKAPLTVTFTGSGTDTDGTIASFYWIFGDGGTSDLQNPTYTYNTPGEYNAVLTVTDNDGATGTDVVEISMSGGGGGLPYTENFESGTLGEEWSAYNTNNGRERVSTSYPHTSSYSALLDCSNNGTYSYAAIILTLDLASYTDVDLSFYWREFSDENHSGDGVFISDDNGATYKRIFSFNNGPSGFIQTNIDLDAQVASMGMNLVNDFKIKFQYYDNYMITSDGYAIDDIEIVEGGSGDLPYTEDFESGSLGEEWSVYTTNNGRERVSASYPHTGSYSALLDCSANGTYSYAAIILTLDLANYTDVDLSFFWREFNDENHSSDGVFISDDNGATYEKIFSFNNGPSGFIQTNIDLDAQVASMGMNLVNDFKIKFQYYDNYMITYDGYAIDDISVTESGKGTAGTGEEETITKIQRAEETGFILVYPNPVSCKLIVEYNVQSAGMVTIDVYDITGRKVQNLSCKYNKPGRHTIQWDANDTYSSEMPNGTYFIRKQTESNTQTTKFVLMR